MPGDGSWRTQRAAEYYTDHDFADFAQEFLRRNMTYQADFETIRDTDGDKEGWAEQWGLRFPLQSAVRAAQVPRSLAARSRSGGCRR